MRQPAVFNVQFFREAVDGVAMVAAACQLTTHPAGTPGSTLPTYTDAGGGTPNPNPIILDDDGRCSLWLDPDEEYLLRLLEPVAEGGALIREFDNVVAAAATTETVTSVNGETGEVVLTPELIDYTAPSLDWFDAANVQDALDQLATRLDAPPAESVTLADFADLLEATNVEDAVAELAANMLPPGEDHEGEALWVNPTTGVREWSPNAGGPTGTIGAEGSVTFPGGLIMKWGTTASISGTGGGGTQITFATAFPTACYSVVASPNGDGGSDHVEEGHSWFVGSIAASGFKISTEVNASTYTWFAIGR